MERSTWVSEGILLVILTALSYVVTYKFQIGFCSFWGIPKELIDISLVGVIAAGLGLQSLLLTVILYLNIPYTLASGELAKEDSIRRRTVITMLFLAFIAIMLVAAYGFKSWIFMLLIGLVTIFAVILLLYWVGDRSKNKDSLGFFQRVQRAVESQPEDGSLFTGIRKAFGVQSMLIFFVVVPIIFFLAEAAGYRSASSESKFPILLDSNKILIKKYGENLIFKPFDIEKEIVKNGSSGKFVGKP